ncbi:hypothetical protein GCM10027599_03350 [Yimella radicis]
MRFWVNSALRVTRQILDATRAAAPSDRSRSDTASRTPAAEPASEQHPYPGDFCGTPDFDYAPKPDGRPDPGEIVWTWVPYEEDHSRGKDRPVLLVGWEGEWLLALPLTSKDHDRDADQERRAGREWVDIGSGPWDRRGRPSEVRLNRVLRVTPSAVRREGAVLDQRLFDGVARAFTGR